MENFLSLLIREKVILGRGESQVSAILMYFFFLRLEYTRQEGTKRKDSYVDGPSPEFKVEMTFYEGFVCFHVLI